MDMLSIRQGMRTMYNYACFDIECLCKELRGQGCPRDEIRRRLDARAAELLTEAAAVVRVEALAGAPDNIVAQVDGFLARTTSLCCVLLAPMIEQWIDALGPEAPSEGAD
jgi:hypothetical protein